MYIYHALINALDMNLKQVCMHEHIHMHCPLPTSGAAAQPSGVRPTLRGTCCSHWLTERCLFSEGAQTPSPLGRYPPALSNGPIGHSSPHLGRRQIDRDDYFHSYPHGRSFHNY